MTSPRSKSNSFNSPLLDLKITEGPFAEAVLKLKVETAKTPSTNLLTRARHDLITNWLGR